MMKHEFEAIAGRTVTDEQYKKIESLYMESNLDKYEFVKSIKAMLKSIPEQITKRILTILVTDNSGNITTPNGCYYHTVKAELLDIDIKTGEIRVREIPNSYQLGYTYDMGYLRVTFVN